MVNKNKSYILSCYGGTFFITFNNPIRNQVLLCSS